MSGVQVLVLMVCAINITLAAVWLDGMTWRTHQWWPMLRLMVCGMAAAGGGWLGWLGADIEFALCLQVGVLAVLMHHHERVQLATRADWHERGSLAEARARNDRHG